MKYYRFLEQALEQSQYHELSGLVMRYETLKATNEQLQQRVISYERKLEQKRTEFNDYVKNKTDQILNLTNEVNRCACAACFFMFFLLFKGKCRKKKAVWDP